MTQQRITPRHRTIPISPLDPYRSIIENNPIEDHFTNKRLQKHMRHVGLMPIENNKEPTSLARDEHKIENSEGERHKRFRRKFIVAMADTVEEVDRARQSEFRKQLDLWNKMYSNRIQRIKAQDRRLERKYGLFIDRQMKKELIRENLSQMPPVPSLSIPRILPTRLHHRRKPKRSSSAPPDRPAKKTPRSRLDELIKRVDKLENEDFNQFHIDINFIKKYFETFINEKNITQDEINKFKDDIIELKNDFNEFAKEQDFIKIIQIEHQNKISELTLTVNKIDNRLKTLEKTQGDYSKIKETLDQQQILIDQLQKQQKPNIIDNSDQIESIRTEIVKYQESYSNKIEKIIKDNINELRQEMTIFSKELKTIIYNEIEKIKGEITTLKSKVTNLEETVNRIKPPEAKKENTLPYMEKLPPRDLFDIKWNEHY